MLFSIPTDTVERETGAMATDVTFHHKCHSNITLSHGNTTATVDGGYSGDGTVYSRDPVHTLPRNRFVVRVEKCLGVSDKSCLWY